MTTAAFVLPDELAATEPPEERRIARDEVRLLVAQPDGLAHARFSDIGQYLRPGDLVVVNISSTLPAAVDARRDGELVVLHFSTPLDDGNWVVELRAPERTGPILDARAGEVIEMPEGCLELIAHAGEAARLWVARVAVDGPIERYLERHGRPIAYAYLRSEPTIDAYQTVFARSPGSAEMPSAARPFTDRLVTDLVTRGVVLAPIALHTGVSSLSKDEPPQPERFAVPETTASLVNLTRRAGGRVVAVGTTVTRAIESVVRQDGTVTSGDGWTNLVLGPERPASVVDGLVTGWHPPEASHLLLLEAVAGRDLVRQAYDAALAERYRWHEFGDACLFLP